MLTASTSSAVSCASASLVSSEMASLATKLMSVRSELTIATSMPRVPTPKEALLVLVTMALVVMEFFAQTLMSAPLVWTTVTKMPTAWIPMAPLSALAKMASKEMAILAVM